MLNPLPSLLLLIPIFKARSSQKKKKKEKKRKGKECQFYTLACINDKFVLCIFLPFLPPPILIVSLSNNFCSWGDSYS